MATRWLPAVVFVLTFGPAFARGQGPATELPPLLTPPADFAGRWRGPYLLRAPAIDPWGRPYLYRTRNPDGRDGFEILCSGADLAPGTPDDIRTGFISDRPTENR